MEKKMKLKRINTSVVKPTVKVDTSQPLPKRMRLKKKKKEGSVTYRKSGKSKMTEMDAKAYTDEVGRQGAKRFSPSELREILKKVK